MEKINDLSTHQLETVIQYELEVDKRNARADKSKFETAR